MDPIARPGVEHRLRHALREPGPSVVRVGGGRRSGKSFLLRAVLTEVARGSRPPRIVASSGSAGPGHRHRNAFADELARSGCFSPGEAEATPAATPTWTALFQAVLDALEAERRPWIVALDEVHTLLSATPELARALGHLWSGARSRGLPLHLVVSTWDDASVDRLFSEEGPLSGVAPAEVAVGSVGVEEVRAHCPGWSPRDRFLLRAALGGSPSTLRHVDPDLRLSTNLQRLVLDPSGTLHGEVPRRLDGQVQKAERYVGIVAALADGAREWGAIRRANPAFGAGNQLAPYVSALQDLGWIEARRSLDAGPRSRRRRYVLADPFPGFWYHAVDPVRGRLLTGVTPAQLWREEVSPALQAHAGRVFPHAVLEALVERGDEALPVGPRRIGSLWGDGYDLPIAGTLRNGAALYGVCVWDRRATVADADDLTRQMKATRFGFGREGRLRVIFTSAGSTEALVRRAARDDLLEIVPLHDLF